MIDKKGKHASGIFDFGQPANLDAERQNCDTSGPTAWEGRLTRKDVIVGR